MATKKNQSTAIMKWDEELAKLAEETVNQVVSKGGGSFFSLRGGQLAYGGSPVPENKMICVIVDSVLENTYYEGDFDPDEPGPPSCYAFGRDESTMAPHEQAASPQAPSCAECQWNQWGSAERGRGKACRNRVRLAVLSAGNITRNGPEVETDPTFYAKGEMGVLPLPPTSVNGWAKYAKQIKGTLHKPPLAVVTEVSVVPDPKTQFKVAFELIDQAPDAAIPALLERNKESRESIALPYPERAEAETKPARKSSGRKPAQRKSSGATDKGKARRPAQEKTPNTRTTKW